MHLKTESLTQSLSGRISAPGSKSYSHRVFIAASLAEGISVIKYPLISGDLEVTLNILKSLGVNISEQSKEFYLVKKPKEKLKSLNKTLDCKNSGTSIRIFSALSLITKGELTFTGEFLRRKRPILPLLNALKSLGGDYTISEDRLIIKRVKKKCNVVRIRGDISSQFITALLFISPLIECPKISTVNIEISTPIVSRPFINITLDVLTSFGINVAEKKEEKKVIKFIIASEQQYRPQVYIVPGDFSSASFIIAASVLSLIDSEVFINNLDMESPQGDKKIVEILRQMGANLKFNPEKKQLQIKGNLTKYPLKGLKIDCKDIPDLFPILSVIGVFAEGKTVLYNISHLRLKESDRISIMGRELVKMGANVIEEDDQFTILNSKIHGAEIDHENDHRIAMACCIAALYAKGKSSIKNIDIVEDSYPNFINDLKSLGAKFQISN
jgi:3-phosphoshikimate 1-carboxyvinyltransferase